MDTLLGLFNIELVLKILCFIVGGFSTFFFSKRLARSKEISEAGKNLRITLYNFLTLVGENNRNLSINPEIIYAKELHDQEVAAREYKGYLSGYSKYKFNNIWERYFCPQGHKKWFLFYVFENKNELERRIEDVVKVTHGNILWGIPFYWVRNK